MYQSQGSPTQQQRYQQPHQQQQQHQQNPYNNHNSGSAYKQNGSVYYPEADQHLPMKDWISHVITLEDQDQITEYFESYRPLSNSFDMGVFKNDLYIKKYKNCLYYGHMQDGKRHGKGILCYFNGRVYEGDWDEDQKHGRGAEIYQNGSKYFGDFIDGKKHGKGQFKWVNGEIYDGEWNQGTKNGSGLWKGVKGDSYIGEWKDGKADGFGVHTWVNGDRYEGEFNLCLKHGLGTERFGNGDVYIGNYQYGKPEGYGEYLWSTGNFYKGYFINGLRHGRGLWQAVKEGGDSYEGEYRNDKKSGYGEYTWKSGNFYKGNFENDLRHGYGEMYWKDGEVYKGYWLNGVQSGQVPDETSRDMDQQDDDVMQHGHNIPMENDFQQTQEAVKSHSKQYERSPPHQQNTSSTLPYIGASDSKNPQNNRSRRTISMSPIDNSSNLPHLNCQQCSSSTTKQHPGGQSFYTFISPKKETAPGAGYQHRRYNQNTTGQSARRKADLSFDNIGQHLSSPRTNSRANSRANSRSNSRNGRAVWKPSGNTQNQSYEINQKPYVYKYS